MTPSNITVALLDDHRVLAESLAQCLSAEQHISDVITCCCAVDFRTALTSRVVDVALLDLNMPGESGLQLLSWLKVHYPERPRCIVLTMHDSAEYLRRSLKSGAKGFVIKDCGTEEIVTAIKTVHMGGIYFSPSVASTASNFYLTNESGLSDRETDVLRLIAQGKRNKEIAESINISTRTVEAHRRNIKIKISAKTTADMVKYAIDNNIQ